PDDPTFHLTNPFLWGAYVMAPWCNRIDAVPTRAGAGLIEIAPDSGMETALHGQVYAVPWVPGTDGTFVARGGGDGWPWPYETTLRLVIGGSSEEPTVGLHQTLTNLGDSPMPGGLGIHPWFRGPLEVRIGSDFVLPSNVDPAAELGPVSGLLDVRAGRVMAVGLDATWPDPEDDEVGLQWPTLGISATLRATSDSGLCIVAASPRSDGVVAVEPETHAPHGLRRLLSGEPHGMRWLEPGATMHLQTELTFRRDAGLAE
ncbi:MAG: hypothetical protein ABI598_02965, partial [Chloroflexota bacterium]